MAGLKTLLGPDQVGPCLVKMQINNALYIFNHLEYELSYFEMKSMTVMQNAGKCRSKVRELTNPDDVPARAHQSLEKSTRTS